ncbi:MAG TPA: (2Fe-2S)-binding protein [Chloroflexota bacterium]|nr:(2Fe-2S)-binding protein [Chloroflexota bacterium]
MYLCVCNGVTESDVRRVARERYPTPDGLVRSLGLDSDGCCGRCAREIDRFVAVALDEHERARAPKMAATPAATAGRPAWCPAF